MTIWFSLISYSQFFSICVVISCSFIFFTFLIIFGLHMACQSLKMHEGEISKDSSNLEKKSLDTR